MNINTKSLRERCWAMLDVLKGWKTLLFNGLAMLLLVAHEFGFVLDDHDDQVKGLIPWIVVVINLILRWYTNTPVMRRSID
jgi:hypothetical protein